MTHIFGKLVFRSSLTRYSPHNIHFQKALKFVASAFFEISQAMSILLPAETWLDVLLFVSRRCLGRSVSLVNRVLHSLAYPLMHEKSMRNIDAIVLQGLNDEAVHLANELFDFDRNVPPPKNIGDITCVFIIGKANSGIVDMLKYFCHHRPIKRAYFFDDRKHDRAEEALPALAQLFPDFFNGQFFEELFISHHGKISIGPNGEFVQHEGPRSRALLCHPSILNFPHTVSVWPINSGKRQFRVGPLLHLLHWKSVGLQHPNRLLRLTLDGEMSEQFLTKFLASLIERFLRAKRPCPYRIHFRTLPNDNWADLLGPSLRANERTGEALTFAGQIVNEEDPLRIYAIERHMANPN